MKTARHLLAPELNDFTQSDALRSKTPRSEDAFTLLEVMIASGIFFMAIFAILSLVSSNIRNAHLLLRPQLDPGLILSDFIQTNKLTEGSDSGPVGDAFPGYNYETDVIQVASNGLFKVDVTITAPGGGPNSSSTVSVLLYRPDSPPGAGF
jgi:hypothetical protein